MTETKSNLRDVVVLKKSMNPITLTAHHRHNLSGLMETVCFSKTSMSICLSTRRHKTAERHKQPANGLSGIFYTGKYYSHTASTQHFCVRCAHRQLLVTYDIILKFVPVSNLLFTLITHWYACSIINANTQRRQQT